MKNSEAFKQELGYIKNPYIKEITRLTLDKADDCIQSIPASSSGKYHPDYVQGEGGLMRHIKAVCKIAKTISDTEIYQNITGDYEEELIETGKDCLLSACLLHDCCKADNTVEHKTLFKHPLLAADLWCKTFEEYTENNNEDIKNLSKLDEALLEHSKSVIARAIASHMGQWNKSKNEKGYLPKPNNGLETLVHLCDYLASRKFIEVKEIED